MKVVFKLTAEQLKRAKMVVECFSARAEEYNEDPDFRLCGNLNAQDAQAVGWNQNQWLELKGNRVSYKGERHPLCRDGGLLVLAYIAGYAGDMPVEEVLWGTRKEVYEAIRDNFERLELVSYETSDRRLKWFEVLSSYLDKRGSWKEIVEAALKRKHQVDFHWTLGRFPEKYRLIVGLLKKDRKVHHEFTLAEIKEARELIKVCGLELN